MVLKATFQKESTKQSLPKVTSEAAVRKCSSLRPATLFKRGFNTGVFFVNIAKILRKAFSIETSGGIGRSSLLNQQQCGMVSTKKVCRSGHNTLFTHY